MKHLDAYVLAAFLDVRPSTIRQWAARGDVTIQGYDKRGRALYDPREVTRRAARARQDRALVSQ